MDSGLIPSTVNVALSHGIKHKHTLILELGPSTLNFGKEVGRALIAVTAIVAITSIIKTFISRPGIVQQASLPASLIEKLEKDARDRERKHKKESSSKRERSSESTTGATLAVPTPTGTQTAAETLAPEGSVAQETAASN